MQKKIFVFLILFLNCSSESIDEKIQFENIETVKYRNYIHNYS